MRSWSLLVTLALVGLSGCRATTPDDFSIRMGESGGFTGWSSGYFLRADGEVLRFTDRHDGEAEQERLGRIDGAQRDALWRQVSESPAFEAPLEGVGGNLTRFLEVTADGQTRRVEWKVGPPRDPPSAAVVLFDHCRDVLAGVARRGDL